ncbi:MAG: class I SAM-dependent rRNA methyltransferase [Gemmatimonadales bacterium]
MTLEAIVNRRGAERWAKGHPWIFASDVEREPGSAGVAKVLDYRGKPLGVALYSPASEIRLRLLDPDPDAVIDADWWQRAIARAAARRVGIDANAYRLVHGEGDGLPSLVVDRYDRWLVVQLLSAGLETLRPLVIGALEAICRPDGILLRNDVAVRRREGLAEAIETAAGTVPDEVEVREGPVRFIAELRPGQKTGAFLDQRPNRLRAGALMPEGGRGLDCFSYHGSFALHLAARAGTVLALDVSEAALARGRRNAELNGFGNLEWLAADAFEALREFARARRRFDLVVVDPPAFAKSRGAVPKALRGYKDINLQALRVVEPGGHLVTASCSFHVGRADFLAAVTDAARDSGRRVTLVEWLGQGADHPEVLTIPETGYLKGMVLRVD